MKDLYTPCYLCNDVVLEGSRRFNELEHLQPVSVIIDFLKTNVCTHVGLSGLAHVGMKHGVNYKHLQGSIYLIV